MFFQMHILLCYFFFQLKIIILSNQTCTFSFFHSWESACLEFVMNCVLYLTVKGIATYVFVGYVLGVKVFEQENF